MFIEGPPAVIPAFRVSAGVVAPGVLPAFRVRARGSLRGLARDTASQISKSANVGKLYFGVAHWVREKRRALTTRIVKPFPTSKKWPPKRLHDWHPPKRGRRVYVEVRFASPLTLPCLVDLLFGSGHPVYPLRRLHPSRTLGLSPTVGPAAARPVPQPRPSRANGDRGVLRGAYRDPRGERW
jgi:hypothetical protein